MRPVGKGQCCRRRRAGVALGDGVSPGQETVKGGSRVSEEVKVVETVQGLSLSS
jgi:hypothetical protein